MADSSFIAGGILIQLSALGYSAAIVGGQNNNGSGSGKFFYRWPELQCRHWHSIFCCRWDTEHSFQVIIHFAAGTEMQLASDNQSFVLGLVQVALSWDRIILCFMHRRKSFFQVLLLDQECFICLTKWWFN